MVKGDQHEKWILVRSVGSFTPGCLKQLREWSHTCESWVMPVGW